MQNIEKHRRKWSVWPLQCFWVHQSQWLQPASVHCVVTFLVRVCGSELHYHKCLVTVWKHCCLVEFRHSLFYNTQCFTLDSNVCLLWESSASYWPIQPPRPSPYMNIWLNILNHSFRRQILTRLDYYCSWLTSPCTSYRLNGVSLASVWDTKGLDK